MKSTKMVIKMTEVNNRENISASRKEDPIIRIEGQFTSQKKAARIAGSIYLLIILSSLFFMVFIDPISSLEGKQSEAVEKIIDNELMFRIQVFYELFMYIGVIILSFALFKVLKPVNKNIAAMGMIFRFGEAALGLFAVIISLAVLVILNSETASEAFGPEQVNALSGIFLEIGSMMISVIFILIGLGTISFCYLFFRSRYIPRIISVFGMFSFSLVMVWASLNIMVPDLAADVQMFFLPWSILFEITIGLWLLIKGIKKKEIGSANKINGM